VSLPADIDSTVCPRCGWTGPPLKTECPNGCREPALGFPDGGGMKAPQRLWQVKRQEGGRAFYPPSYFGQIPASTGSTRVALVRLLRKQK
jgi:hypothetical protein